MSTYGLWCCSCGRSMLKPTRDRSLPGRPGLPPPSRRVRRPSRPRSRPRRTAVRLPGPSGRSDGRRNPRRAEDRDSGPVDLVDRLEAGADPRRSGRRCAGGCRRALRGFAGLPHRLGVALDVARAHPEPRRRHQRSTRRWRRPAAPGLDPVVGLRLRSAALLPAAPELQSDDQRDHDQQGIRKHEDERDPARRSRRTRGSGGSRRRSGPRRAARPVAG